MGRIKIEDLPEDQEISKEEMRKVLGGNIRNEVDPDLQIMDLDLQDKQNQYSQAFQMISNLMKSYHDTAKSIIQNMR